MGDSVMRKVNVASVENTAADPLMCSGATPRPCVGKPPHDLPRKGGGERGNNPMGSFAFPPPPLRGRSSVRLAEPTGGGVRHAVGFAFGVALFAAPLAARAQDTPENRPAPSRTLPPIRTPQLNPTMRDRGPLQVREKGVVPGARPPERTGTPTPGGPPPTRSPTPTPPPAPAPTPPETRPLPGATSVLGGNTKVDVKQVGADDDVDDRRKRGNGKALFNFENAQLIDIVKQISKLSGKNFILRENLKGQKLTILCEEPVTPKEAYRAFLVALEINNLAVVQAGKFLKVEERKNAIKQAIPTVFDGEESLPGDESMVTYIYRLKHVELEQAQRLVDSMLNKAVGDLQVYQPNLLIMSDAAININRIKRLLDKVDVEGLEARIHVIEVKYAAATDLANKLTTLLDPNKAAQKKQSVPGENKESKENKESAKEDKADGADQSDLDLGVTKILADERTNKIIFVGPKEALDRVKRLVDMLDTPEGPSNAPLVHVHNLENADAEKVTQALNNLAQAAAKKDNKGGKKGAAADGAMFEGEVKVTAHQATNSLVIVASQRDYRNLSKVIRKLDVRRPQVFVESVIMEVTLNRTQDLALDWFSAYTAPVPGLGDGVGIAGNPGGQSRIKGVIADTTTGGLASLLGFLAFKGPSIPVKVGNNNVDLPSFGAVLNALETDGNVDVLSTPHILTTDNVKAEIVVGQTVPFAGGFTSNLGGGAISSFAPIVSVQRQDVALKFIVTPHVSSSSFVRLELDQEVSDLGPPVDIAPGQTQPTTTKRTAKTTVVVKDEQTVIIGGLISDKKTHSETKIPLLGDIPWLGFLFRSQKDDIRKTNLLIILTPHIIRSDDDFRRVYERKLQERQEFMETFYGVYAPIVGVVDYDRKVGPMGTLHDRIHNEMMRVENGGPGLAGESIIINDDRAVPADDGPFIPTPADPEPAKTPEGQPPAGEGGQQSATPPETPPGQPAPPPPAIPAPEPAPAPQEAQ
jgi:general secretion pathway protein D